MAATLSDATADVITVLSTARPVGKHFELRNGQVHKGNGARFALGQARGAPIATAQHLMALLANVTAETNTVLIPGHFIGNDDETPFEIITKSDLADRLDLPEDSHGLAGIHTIDGQRMAARLKVSIEPCAWLPLDFDKPPAMPEALAKLDIAGRLARLESIVPGISTCERVECRSSSARVVEAGHEPDPVSHAWVRVSDPEKIATLRLHVHVEAELAGLSFPSPNYSRTTGEVVGQRRLTLCDLAVWGIGRIVFTAAPCISSEMAAAGWTVAGPGLRIVNEGAGTLDLGKIKLPSRKRRAAYCRATGEHLEFSGKGRSLAIVSRGLLTHDTPIDTDQAPVSTFGEALRYLRDHPEIDRLRCQAPFRRSASEAAFIRLTGPGLAGFVHDSGVTTTFRCEDPDVSVLAACAATFLQAAVAQEFAERHGEDFRYVAARGHWYHWTGRCWEPEQTELVFHLIARLFAARSFETDKKIGFSDVRGAEAIARSIRSIGMHARAFNTHPHLINHRAGTFDLLSGEARPWSRQDYLTQCANAAPRPGCPKWLAFLSRVTGGDLDLQAYLARLVGYSMTGYIGEHVLFYFFGEGRNGKTTFIEVIAAVLGSYARSVMASLFVETRSEQHPTGIADFEGYRLVYTTEVGAGQRWNTELIKRLTGGDTMSARFMRQDFFTYAPQCKLIISGNHKLDLRRVDIAIRARLQFVPFTVVIPEAERVKDLKETLIAEESNGILDWVLKGCVEWHQRGLEPPSAVRNATEEYFEVQDTVGRWLSECCDIGTPHSASAAELYLSWQRWSTDNGESPLSKKMLGSILDERGFPAARNTAGTQRRRKGLKLTVAEALAVEEWRNRKKED
jgi:P4 family phage/plasmid primase-like protien